MNATQVTWKNNGHTCESTWSFERLNYFYGQMLGVSDFRTEQAYFLEKLKLHNRCFHGYGVVCGLGVEEAPKEEICEPKSEKQRQYYEQCLAQCEHEIATVQQKIYAASGAAQDTRELNRELSQKQAEREEWRRKLDQLPPRQEKNKKCPAELIVHCGLALDCHGNELIVNQPLRVDLWSALSTEEQRHACEHGPTVVYLTLCYCAQPTHPSRPVIPDSCGALSECNYGRYRDSVKVKVTLEKPALDKRCNPCCEPCDFDCVLLATICWNPSRPLTNDDIDNGVRRKLALYEPTVITGISWQHGAVYTSDQAKVVLGTEQSGGTRTDGIEIQFSKPVYAETLTPGVIDLWRIQGGRGIRGMISRIEGRYKDKPVSGLITSVKCTDESGETLSAYDEVLITVRTSFILDECCQPVDGTHVGGRVPQIAEYRGKYPVEYPEEQSHPCPHPPGRYGPWTSGTGTPGGNFESWFFVK